MSNVKIVQDEDYLAHHGIKGQRWGFRRYQNPDGSLTEEGRRRYDIKEAKIKAKAEKAAAKATRKNIKLAAKAEKQSVENAKRLRKEQEKLLKLDMKRIKKTAAYERGKKFGEAFAPAIGSKLGESIGTGIGNTLFNWQKWSSLNNEKINAQTKKMEILLKKQMYENGDWSGDNKKKD